MRINLFQKKEMYDIWKKKNYFILQPNIQYFIIIIITVKNFYKQFLITAEFSLKLKQFKFYIISRKFDFWLTSLRAHIIRHVLYLYSRYIDWNPPFWSTFLNGLLVHFSWLRRHYTTNAVVDRGQGCSSRSSSLSKIVKTINF